MVACMNTSLPFGYFDSTAQKDLYTTFILDLLDCGVQCFTVNAAINNLL